ncbi:MAG: TIGR03905 family TSCPD domain-containing protein [Clostridia bacterium]|nr:TIGR03905 family TSCPD domain-containing protein [Clostridia bacterium]
MHYTYRPRYVCSTQIDMDVNDGVITNVRFTGGCNGNLKAIGKLVNGMTADQIESTLLGNTCGPRPTSCADQLARAVRAAAEAEKQAG